jgi:RimJ/RimL family protein N-acetyltransferase
MLIREVMSSDAESFIRLTKQVEDNSEFMLWEPGERNIKPEQQRKMIENMSKSENSTIIVAESDNELVGYLVVFGGGAKRNMYSAYIVIGILEEYRGKGVGTKLFEALENWASDNNIHRLELTVVTQNEAGVSLYKKMGFEIEGIKRHSLFIDGNFVDEYYMSKLI